MSVSVRLLRWYTCANGSQRLNKGLWLGVRLDDWGFGVRFAAFDEDWQLRTAVTSPSLLPYVEQRDTLYICWQRIRKNNTKFNVLRQTLHVSLSSFGCEWNQAVNSCPFDTHEATLGPVLFYLHNLATRLSGQTKSHAKYILGCIYGRNSYRSLLSCKWSTVQYKIMERKIRWN